MIVPTELKDLILALDANRQTLGNAQYYMDPQSSGREALSRFANQIAPVRREAFRSIERHFFIAVRDWDRWADSLEEALRDIGAMVSLYTWSLVYQLRFQGVVSEENVAERVEGIKQRCLDTLGSRLAEFAGSEVDPGRVEQVRQMSLACFEQEKEALARQVALASQR